MSEAIVKALDPEWQALVARLPVDLEASARQSGALQRHRGFRSAADLLRVLLMYATLLSLQKTALWACCLQICDISRQALERRVLASSAWLRDLLSQRLGALVSVPLDCGDLVQRVVVFDASVLARPGSPGTEWRLHLGWQPFAQQVAQVARTDQHGGEGLDHFTLRAGDLVLGDRAYGLWRSLLPVLEAHAWALLRVTWSNLPLRTVTGERCDICQWLCTLLPETACAEICVSAADDPQHRPLRLLAGRLPAEKAAEARTRVLQQAREAQHAPHPNALLAADFCLLITNLPATCPLPLILSLYAIRWQVEWCFRRWQSLWHLDELPAFPARIAEPALLAKVLLALLLQQRIAAWPWQHWWTTAQPMPDISTLADLTYTYVCEILRPVRALAPLLADPTPFMRHLRSSHRRTRPLQLTAALRRVQTLFANLAQPGAADLAP